MNESVSLYVKNYVYVNEAFKKKTVWLEHDIRHAQMNWLKVLKINLCMFALIVVLFTIADVSENIWRRWKEYIENRKNSGGVWKITLKNFVCTYCKARLPLPLPPPALPPSPFLNKCSMQQLKLIISAPPDKPKH